MNKLQELLESNAELKAKIEALDKNPKATTADFIALVKEYGVELTETDFKPVPAGGAISDDELETVAGGNSCICVGAGGGTDDDYHGPCGCVLGGGGDAKGINDCCRCVLFGEGSYDPLY